MSAETAQTSVLTCTNCGAKFLAAGQDICKVCAARKLREIRDQAP